MTTLTIQIPDKDRDLFEKLAERLNGKVIEAVDDARHPNVITKKAIADARLGKTKKLATLIYSLKTFSTRVRFTLYQ